MKCHLPSKKIDLSWLTRPHFFKCWVSPLNYLFDYVLPGRLHVVDLFCFVKIIIIVCLLMDMHTYIYIYILIDQSRYFLPSSQWLSVQDAVCLVLQMYMAHDELFFFFASYEYLLMKCLTCFCQWCYRPCKNSWSLSWAKHEECEKNLWSYRNISIQYHTVHSAFLD